MKIAFVMMHVDCPLRPEGQQPPKCEITDFSESSEQTRLQCTLCAAELTLTCHTADNPATPLSKGLPDGSVERPH